MPKMETRVTAMPSIQKLKALHFFRYKLFGFKAQCGTKQCGGMVGKSENLISAYFLAKIGENTKNSEKYSKVGKLLKQIMFAAETKQKMELRAHKI